MDLNMKNRKKKMHLYRQKRQRMENFDIQNVKQK